MHNELIGIKGESNNGSTWDFVFDDGLYGTIKKMNFSAPIKDSVGSLFLMAIIDNDTVNLQTSYFPRNCKLVLKYHNCELTTVTLNMGNGVFKHVIRKIDHFIIENPPFELYARSGLGYGRFDASKQNAGLTYEQNIDKYIAITKEHPTSEQLMIALYDNITNFRSMYDAKKLYGYFSDEIRESHYGQQVANTINKLAHFENHVLINAKTNKSEQIIINDKKYNMLVFSASWCAPCHAQIPILKQIHSDLKDKLDLVYISLDDSKSVEAWKELMKKEEIPWRSLLAVKELETIKAKYFVQFIPYTLLLYPDGKMEIIDVREVKDKDRLYDLLK